MLNNLLHNGEGTSKIRLWPWVGLQMPDTVAVQAALERITASAGFANSPRLSRFLRFVVEESAAGRASDLKEYVVGVRVFDKAESFDPSVDPTVRVEASKLRAKLARYYETDGRRDRILIDIPKGHYGANLRIRTVPESHVEAQKPAPRALPSRSSPMPKREMVAWALTLTMGLALLAGALAPQGAESSSGPVIRFHLYPPDHVRVGDLRVYGPAVISPDGRRLAFVGLDEQGHSEIWLRDLHELTAKRIEGTAGASYPFWSPDASQIAYFADRKLKRIRIGSGVPDILDDAPIGRSGTWSMDGTIVFVSSPEGPLRMVSTGERGQNRAAVPGGTTAGAVHLHPTFLPDGHRFLFVQAGPTAAVGVPFIGRLDATRESQPYSQIPETHSNVVYAAAPDDASAGYLLYVRSASLMAQPVDARNLEPRGEARLVATGIRASLERWRGDFSASQNGVLVYRAARTNERPLAWYDRRGGKLGDVGGSGTQRDVELSPDGRWLAVQRYTSPNWSDIWIQDLARGTESRFTLAGNPHYTPVWAHNGQGLFFVARRSEGFGLYYGERSERHPRQVLKHTKEFIAVHDVSPDGRRLLYQMRTAAGHVDLWTLELGDRPREAPLLQTPFDEVEGQFSPDSRWVAYVSNESGRPEVYLSSLRSPNTRLQVSANGGVQPRWRRDGRELFYVGLDGRLMSASVAAGLVARLGAPVALFQTHIDALTRDALEHFDYDVSADGQRIITLASPEPEAVTPWTVVINWPAGLSSR